MKKKSVLKTVWAPAKYLIVPMIVLAVFGAIFYIIDHASDGGILEALDKRFTYYNSYKISSGNIITDRAVDWTGLKNFIVNIMIVAVFIITVIILVISDFRRKRTERASAKRSASYIDRFILRDEPLPADIPEAYGEVFTKISEIKNKEQIREQNLLAETARKDDLVTYLAHDLKTPLTSVIGYLTLLKDEPQMSNEMRKRYTDVAVSKARRLEELVSELFEITRYNIRQIELDKGNVNLSVMLEQIIFEFNPLLKDKQLSFATDITPDINAYVDVDKTERIIDNLIRNAIFYSYPETEIKISLGLVDSDDEEGGKKIRLVVENRGKTIAKDKLERVFDQFFRVDSSRGTQTGGSGLGLAIVKQLVTAHDGSITAESENETIRFTVLLPG